MTAWLTTTRVRADVLLVGRRTITGDIHLQPHAKHHAGGETAIDFMNRGERFFPVILEGEQPLFVARSQVMYLRLPALPPIEDPDRASAARRLGLEVELCDGTTLEGLVSLELPPDRTRALDFLNLLPRYFAILTPDAIRIINRDYVRAVSPLVDLDRVSA
jgi:hypothetical protein